MDSKKKRGANFSYTEVDCLMKCILPELSRIENKKIDGVTLREKHNAWLRVADCFNSICDENIYRDVNSIKMKYENIKRVLKRKVLASNATCLSPTEIKWFWFEKELFTILQLGIEGLELQADSSYVETSPQISNELCTTEMLIESDCADEDQVFIDTVQGDGTEVQEKHDTENELDACTSSNESLGHFSKNDKSCENNVADVTHPLSSNGSKDRSVKCEGKSNNCVVEQKNANIDSIKKLREGKIELLKIQTRCAQMELQLKANECSQSSRRWNLEEQILEKTLDELHEESKRKKLLFELTLEKEKLAIECMKCEKVKNMKLNKKLKNLHDC